MVNYIYDGSFEGILTCIHEIYYRRQVPEKILCEEEAQLNLLSADVFIQTDALKAQKVYNAIKEKISSFALSNITYVYLSDLINSGKIIYEYLHLGWKLGKRIDNFLSDDRVLIVHQITQKVKGEAHRMLGLLRFKEVHGNIFYAAMSPDFNILGLIAPHFADRLSNERWIIYDDSRKIAAIYNKKEWIIESVLLNPFPDFGEEEEYYQTLWKQFYKSIAIKERTNPKLQKNFMPKRYWTYLVEKN